MRTHDNYRVIVIHAMDIRDYFVTDENYKVFLFSFSVFASSKNLSQKFRKLQDLNFQYLSKRQQQELVFLKMPLISRYTLIIDKFMID